MCHIIGIYAILHDGHKFKASYLARMLKKEIKDLKSYFTELGLEASPIKENDKDDLLVSSNISYKEKNSRKRSKDLEQELVEVSEHTDIVGQKRSKKSNPRMDKLKKLAQKSDSHE